MDFWLRITRMDSYDCKRKSAFLTIWLMVMSQYSGLEMTRDARFSNQQSSPWNNPCVLDVDLVGPGIQMDGFNQIYYCRTENFLDMKSLRFWFTDRSCAWNVNFWIAEVVYFSPVIFTCRKIARYTVSRFYTFMNNFASCFVDMLTTQHWEAIFTRKELQVCRFMKVWHCLLIQYMNVWIRRKCITSIARLFASGLALRWSFCFMLMSKFIRPATSYTSNPWTDGEISTARFPLPHKDINL